MAFDHPEEARGFELEIATEHVHFADLAKTFTKVTGKPAIVTLEEYFASQPLGSAVDVSKAKMGERTVQGNEVQSLVSYQENFSGFWIMWSGRVKSVEEWMKKTGYTGEARPVLKDWPEWTGATKDACRGRDSTAYQ